MTVEDAEDSSAHQSEVILTVVVVIVVIIVVAVPAAILTAFLAWYRIKLKTNLKGPPTYIDLLRMSTIYDPDDIRQNSDTYNLASQEEYGITYMELQMMKTDID